MTSNRKEDESFKDMIQYIFTHLIPKIAQVRSETLNKLITFNYTLSLEELQQLEKEVSILFTTNSQIAQTAQILYYACYFIAVIDHQPFDLTYFNFTYNIISYLKENCPDFDIKESLSIMLDKVILAVTSPCIDFNEVLDWAEKIKQIKEELQYNDTKIAESWIDQKLKNILLANIWSNDKKSIKRYLQEIKMAEDAGIDLSMAARIAVNNALNWIEITNDTLDIAEITGEHIEKDERGAREILELLKSLQIKDKELTSTINQLSTRFGVIETYVSNSRLILEKDRLKFVHPPIYLNTDELSQLRKTVFKGVLDGITEVSIKALCHWKLEQLNIYQKERDILEGISDKHPTFLKYYGSYIEETYESGRKLYEFSMVMEFCESNLLADITRRNREHRSYSIDEYKYIVISLLGGFSYLEERKIYHRDIRPEHIFLTRDGRPKIAEFSMITDIKAIQGRKDFMSPELYDAYWEYRTNPNAPKRIKYKPKKSDVYSLGLVFLNMYTLATVKGLNEYDAQPQLQDYVAQFKPDWVSMMLREMLNPDYKRRVSFEYMHSKLNHLFSNARNIEQT